MKTIAMKILICIFLISIGSFAYFSPVYGESEEINATYGYLGYELYYEINSTKEVKVGDFLNVKLVFITDGDISSVEIYVSIYGAEISYDKSWTGISLTTNQSIVDTATLQVKKEGEIRCFVDASYWDDAYGDWEYGSADFLMTQAKAITYDKLNQNFINLNQSYNELNGNYSQLEGNYNDLDQNYNSLESDYENLQQDYDEQGGKYDIIINDLNMYTNLLYVFIITTAVFVALTVIVYVKRSKTRIAMNTAN